MKADRHSPTPHQTWTDAFSHARKLKKPVNVRVPVSNILEVARIYPSGRCRHLYYLPETGLYESRLPQPGQNSHF